MFDNLGDDFPFDWLVKCFQKKKILWIYLIAIQEIVYFLPCFFYKRVKTPCRLYICVSGQFLPKMP